MREQNAKHCEIDSNHEKSPEERLRALWDACFVDERSGAPADPRLGAAAWGERRAEHLPLTLVVIRAGLEDGQLGATAQAAGEQVLLLTVGLSEEQVALAMALHAGAGCRRFVPLAPPEIWQDVAPRVQECLDVLCEDAGALQIEDVVPVRSGEPASTFQAVLRWVRSHPGLCVAVDCTGGQKPMVAGAADAASFLGLPACYLDFSAYDPVLRRPLPHSCRYRRLEPSDQVLSLSQRRATLEAFTSRRFDVAAVRAGQVLEAASASGYLDEHDVTSVRKAWLLAERSRHWMELRYDHPLLQDHPLHRLFVTSREQQRPPRDIVEGLRDQATGDELSSYVADELWRLDVLAQIGAGREALVGLVGLIELVVDSLMFLPWFEQAVIEDVTARRWFRAREREPLPSAADLGWVGLPMPPALLPPGFQQRKLDLLRRGSTRFEVWVAVPEDGPPRLDLPLPDRNQPRLEAEVRVAVPSPPLTQDGSSRISKGHWRRCWGAYPQSDWVMQRHACAHLRAPLFDSSLLDAAREVAPRFLELLYRLQRSTAVELEQAGTEEWITWWHDPAWSRRSRLPWGADGDACVARWLDVPLPPADSPAAPELGEGLTG